MDHFYLYFWSILVDEVFTIDPTAGRVTVIGNLDREFAEEFLLLIVVEDLNAEKLDGDTKFDRENAKRNVRQIASTTIAIIVDDVNDNLPLFRKPVYKTTVRENSDRGTVISRIFADDLDRNRTITYR